MGRTAKKHIVTGKCYMWDEATQTASEEIDTKLISQKLNAWWVDLMIERLNKIDCPDSVKCQALDDWASKNL